MIGRSLRRGFGHQRRLSCSEKLFSTYSSDHFFAYFFIVEFSGFSINMLRSNFLIFSIMHASENCTQNIFQFRDNSSSKLRDHECFCVAVRTISSHCWRFFKHWSSTRASLIFCWLSWFSFCASDFFAARTSIKPSSAFVQYSIPFSTAKVDRAFGIPLSCFCKASILVKIASEFRSKFFKVDMID